MSLWNDLPTSVRDTGVLDPLQGALSAIDTAGLAPHEVTDVDGTWSVRSVSVDLPELAGLSVDPATGRFGGAGSSTPLEFVGTVVTVSYGRHLVGPGGAEDGGWHLDLDVPGIRLLVPFLRGAKLDGQGQLVHDADNPQVRFILPRIVVRTMQLAGADVRTRLRSASTSGNPMDDIYSFVRMTPGHALIGPGQTVGFAFRTAELDLSDVADPPGLPAGARAVAGEWQGLHLPEVRLFVAPDGLSGLAVSAGVRDLWIGIGDQAGVTGAFSAEVVNRGGTPEVTARFVSPAGRHVAAVANAAVAVDDQSLFVVDAQGGLAPLVTRIEVVGGSTVTADRVTVTVPAVGTVTLRVTVTDGASHASTPVEFQALRAAAPAGANPTLANPASLTMLTPERGRMVVVSETSTTVTVRLDPETPANWTWTGGSSTGTQATVPLAADTVLTVSGTPTLPANARTIGLDCYFLFDRPKPAETTDAWWRNPANTSSVPAQGRNTPAAGPTFTALATSRRADIGATPLVVDGYASFEADTSRPDRNDNDTHRAYNLELSRRRLDAAVAILRDLGYNATAGTAHGHADARDGLPLDPGTTAPGPGTSSWWLARAKDATPAPQQVQAQVRRGAASQPLEQRDPQPPATGRPDCFRRIGVEIELIRSTFVRCEIWGEFDIQTAVESSLEEGGEAPLGGRGPNQGDGLCAFRVRLRIATDQNSWEVLGEFRALEADLDGLWEGRDTKPGTDQASLNVLGALAVMGPLSAAVADLSPAAGTLVMLGTMALGASNLVKTRVVTLRGGEIVVSDGIIAPDGSTTTDRGTQVSIMLDVEVQFWFDLTIIKVPQDRPVTTRYKAVGIRSQWDAGVGVDYLPIPVFDPNRGYVLDIQPGSLIAQPPLDEILRIFGVRVSRDNPTYLEVEAGIGVPLGPVTIDTIRVRARLDALEPPQLTKLGASLDIPNTIHGAGSVEITGAGFKATFDLTVIPLSLRAAATLAIETRNGVTGLLIGIEVEFPVPLILGNSGLGIFGLMGGVGINYARLEDASARVPALDWVMKQLGVRHNVMHPDGWKHSAGAYAFAAGLLVGTMEGGYVLHLKGIILIEIPGPRLLLIMKADVLKAPPALGASQEATFLAVLDIDFGRGTITLGITADYTIKEILKIHVPVTAFFDTNNPEKWFIDLGTYDDRVTVNVLDVFTGSGYLMVHGNGISIPPLPAATGMAVATGFHIQAVLMGSKRARLYVEVAAGFDAILGFDPFFLAGKIYIRGELMLFIISIGVSAELTVMVGKRLEGGVLRDDPYVKGEVCGKVDFFFFSVKGCVSLEIGHKPDPDPDPRDLVAGLKLAGRSPALVEGTAAGRSADQAIGDAAEVISGAVHGDVPVVPLDAIPVILFHEAPAADGLSVLGGTAFGSTGVSGVSAWRRIGERWWAYNITSVTLTGALGTGPTPATWWSQSSPTETGAAPALALLNWLPTPFTSTLVFGETLRTQIEHRWGTVCEPAAPPQEQLWTFAAQLLGPSDDGWLLDGIAWPDPIGVPRSAPAWRRLVVTELWRTGDPVVDVLQGTDPAEVVGDAVACPRGRPASPSDPFKLWTVGNGTLDPTTWAGDVGVSGPEVTELLAGGVQLHDLAAAWQSRASDPELARLKGCEGRILAAPLFTSDDPAPFGTGLDRERVQAAREKAGWHPDTLADALSCTLGEGLARFTALLLVQRESPNRLVVEVRDAHGNVLDRREVDTSTWVGPANPLPGAWLDPTGPWASPVELAGRVAAKIANAQHDRPVLSLVTFDRLPEEATHVVIGWERRDAQKYREPRFWVVAASALTFAEVRRHDFDETVKTSDREALTNGLTQDPTDHALLVPGITYDVSITWEFDSATGEHAPTTAPAFANPHTQVFRFTAEPVANVPKDLGPWLLDTNPGMGDAGVFCQEPLRVTLGTQNVTRLFDAYGHHLEVTVLSASGHHPEPPGGGSPGAAVVLPLSAVDARDSVLMPKKNHVVLNPWDEMAGGIADRLPCVDASHVTRTVEEIVLHYDLEPLTDYLLDIHAVPTGGGPRIRVYRANFTTSRFKSLDHLASWIKPAPLDHRLARNMAAVSALPDRPTGRTLDDAVQAAGLPVPQTPTTPRVEVWWSADPVPQPLALVIECSEQLVRERVMPVTVSGPVDASDPTHKWWAARPVTWLQVAPTAVPPDPAAAASFARAPIVGPGGTRVLVLLAANSRGKRVTLDLVQAPDPLATDPGRSLTVIDVTLNRAPWEVEF